MSEMGMVERVARALCRESEIYPEDQWERLADWARAAIGAMREPTGAMVTAFMAEGERQHVAFDEFSEPMFPAKMYAAMIDTALTTSPST